MANQIKDLISALSRVQASLTRIQTIVQQYNQDVLNIKLRMGRLEEIWNKYEEIQDRLERSERSIGTARWRRAKEVSEIGIFP